MPWALGENGVWINLDQVLNLTPRDAGSGSWVNDAYVAGSTGDWLLGPLNGTHASLTDASEAARKLIDGVDPATY